MRKVCSYCSCEIDAGGSQGEPESHGLCDACYAHYQPQWDGLSMSAYLDRFEAPVLLVGPDVRVQAVNAALARQFGIDRDAAIGLRGGEALECVHARQPGGCGGTVHCRTCAIRRSVTEVLASGEPRRDELASLERAEGVAALRIVAEPHDGMVVVRVEPV